jgi:hypothetical protein
MQPVENPSHTQLQAMFALYDTMKVRVRIDTVRTVDEHAWIYSTGEVNGRLAWVGRWVSVLSWQRELEVARRENGAWHLSAISASRPSLSSRPPAHEQHNATENQQLSGRRLGYRRRKDLKTVDGPEYGKAVRKEVRLEIRQGERPRARDVDMQGAENVVGTRWNRGDGRRVADESGIDVRDRAGTPDHSGPNPEPCRLEVQDGRPAQHLDQGVRADVGKIRRRVEQL